MDANGSGAHCRTEEGNLAFHGVENILRIGSQSGSLLVLESEGMRMKENAGFLVLSQVAHGCSPSLFPCTGSATKSFHLIILSCIFFEGIRNPGISRPTLWDSFNLQQSTPPNEQKDCIDAETTREFPSPSRLKSNLKFRGGRGCSAFHSDPLFALLRGSFYVFTHPGSVDRTLLPLKIAVHSSPPSATERLVTNFIFAAERL